MDITIKYKKTNVARIFIKDLSAFDMLRDNFSIRERNHGYIANCRRRGIRVAPEKEYVNNSCIKRNGEFELGMLTDIILYCKNTFFDRVLSFNLDDKIKDYLASNKLVLKTDVIIDEQGHDLRPFQSESMQIALNRQNGTFVLGTGAGKTVCTALLIHNILHYKLSKKILLIIPFPQLANQTFNDIKNTHLAKHNYTFAKWFGKNDSELDINAQVVVAGADILRSRYDKLKKEIEKFDCVIVDEMHMLKLGNVISKILINLPAKYKYGFTGTLPYDKKDLWSVKGKCGPVRYELPSVDLREDKYLSPVSILGIKILLNDKPEAKSNYTTYNDELEWLSENTEFNNTIGHIANKLNNNTLILIKRLQHGQNLLDICKNYPKKIVYYIRGEISIDEREKIIKMVEENNNIILIAQVSTFSTGINVKNLHNIIFPGTMGKSNITIVQSIGRGLRLHKDKKELKVLDIIPNTKYCSKHSETRQQIYSNEKIPYKEISMKPVI